MAHGIRDKPNNSTTSAHFTLQDWHTPILYFWQQTYPRDSRPTLGMDRGPSKLFHLRQPLERSAGGPNVQLDFCFLCCTGSLICLNLIMHRLSIADRWTLNADRCVGRSVPVSPEKYPKKIDRKS